MTFGSALRMILPLPLTSAFISRPILETYMPRVARLPLNFTLSAPSCP